MGNTMFEDFRKSSESMMKKFMIAGAITMVLMFLGVIAFGIGRKEDIKAFKIVGVVLMVAGFVVFIVFAFSGMTGMFDMFNNFKF